MMRENPTLAKNNGDLASQTQIHWLDLIAETNGTLKALPVIFGKIIDHPPDFDPVRVRDSGLSSSTVCES